MSNSNDSLRHPNMMISKIITCQSDDDDCSEITLESGDFDLPEIAKFGAVVDHNNSTPTNNDTIPIMPLRRRIPSAFAQVYAIPPAFATAQSRTQRAAGASAGTTGSSNGPRPLTRRSDRTSMYPSNSLYSKSTHTTTTTGASTTTNTTTSCSAATSAALNASISSATTFFDSPVRLSQIREPATEGEGDDGEEECSFAADLGGVAVRDPPSPPEVSKDEKTRESKRKNKNLCQRKMLQKSASGDDAVICTPPLLSVEFEPETNIGRSGCMQRMEESQDLSMLTLSPQQQPRHGCSLLAEITKQKERDEEAVSRQPLRAAQRRASLQDSSLVSVSPNRTVAAASASSAWYLNRVEHSPQPFSLMHAASSSSPSTPRRSSMGAAKCSTTLFATNRGGVTVRDRLRAFEP